MKPRLVSDELVRHLQSAAELMIAARAPAPAAPIGAGRVEALLEQILVVLSRPASTLPVSVDLWDTKHIAAYLKRSTDNVRKEIVCLPSFPRPLRLPVHGKAQALYKAREVVRWAESLAN